MMKMLKPIDACVNSPYRKMGVQVIYCSNPHLAAGAIAIVMLALSSTGCISTGETIRVSGQVVDTDGQAVVNAPLIATATKRGGTLTSPGEIADPDAKDEAREATVDQSGDGRFTATSNWSGRLTLSVEGYKIRRVDDLGTEFLVPSQSFFQSQDQVRLEVVKDE